MLSWQSPERFAAICCLVLVTSANSGFGQTIIDDFSDAIGTIEPPGVQQNSVGSTTVLDTGLSGVMGGSREMTVEMTVAGGGSPLVKSGVVPFAQILDYSSSVAADGLVTIYYDANGVGLNADLSLSDGIELSLLTDSSALPYTVELTLSDGTITESDVFNGAMVGLQLVSFDFANFPTVDLANLESIEVEIDPSIAGDFETAGPGLVTFGEPVCGNGELEPIIGEECDDGNAFDGDGCDTDCTISAACTFAHAGPPTERFVGGCGAPSFGGIQAAIDASADGDIVSICPGSYSESFDVTREVRVRSTGGAGVTTINPTDSPLVDIRQSGVVIEGLGLAGGTASTVISASAICGLGESSACAQPGRGSNVTIRDNLITGGGTAIAWSAKVDCALLDGNQITGAATRAVSLDSPGGADVLVTVQQNTIAGPTAEYGVALEDKGESLLVAQNAIDDTTNGLLLGALTGTSAAMIAENDISNHSGVGVELIVGGDNGRIVQNNITGNGVGLLNTSQGLSDATLNWWGSQTGPFHATERPGGLGDEVLDVVPADTSFIEFLCAPAPGGFPSVAGECEEGEPSEEILFVAIGESPDVSSSGRFISFVSGEDLNGDARITVDNTDGSEETFLLNRKPSKKAGAFCLGGTNPGAPCTRQRDCPEDLDSDPIVTEGACVLVTQTSHDPSGAGSTLAPRVNRRGDTTFTSDADLAGVNPDGSLEVLLWSRREFRRNEPPNPNSVVFAITPGDDLEDSTAPQPDRGGRRVSIESAADLTGDNADGNVEIFAIDTRQGTIVQITDSTGSDNRRPRTHTGRQVMFDSEADYTGQNGDGNREIYLAKFKRGGWDLEQITDTAPPVENFAGSVSKRGRILVFSSNGNMAGQNGDGNRELFLWEKGAIEQITSTTVGENVNPDSNPRGRFVTFESTSDADDTGASLTNRRTFLFDRKKGTTIQLSRSLFGGNFNPRISNGRFVVWESTANLTGSNPGGERVIYLFDRRKDN